MFYKVEKQHRNIQKEENGNQIGHCTLSLYGHFLTEIPF